MEGMTCQFFGSQDGKRRGAGLSSTWTRYRPSRTISPKNKMCIFKMRRSDSKLPPKVRHKRLHFKLWQCTFLGTLPYGFRSSNTARDVQSGKSDI